MLRRIPLVVLLFLQVSLSLVQPLAGKERVFRLFDERDGLPVGEVVTLAQDRAGFIWIGTFAGLVRYDGHELRQWAPELLRGHVTTLIAGPGGEVLVRIQSGRPDGLDPSVLYRVVTDGVEPVAGPDGGPLSGVSDAAFGERGHLCAVRDGDVACHSVEEGWIRHRFDDGERAQRVRPGADDAIIVLTDRGLWELTGEGAKRRLHEVPGALNVVVHPDGSLYLQTTESDRGGRILKLRDSALDVVVEGIGRATGLAVRRDVVWAASDRLIAVIRPNRPPEILPAAEELPSGAPLLVDHEGSLWFGTYRGLLHMPEPETVVWTTSDGLPSPHVRFLARNGSTMWVSTWSGLGRLSHTGGTWDVDDWSAPIVDRMCLDGRGDLWLANLRRGFLRYGVSGRALYADRDTENWLGCSRRSDGRLWLTNRQGIFVTPRGVGPPERLTASPMEPAGPVFHRQIFEDRGGRLWVSADENICSAPVDTIRPSEVIEWQCQQIPGTRGISGMIELADGHLWIATARAGLWWLRDDRWVQIAGSTLLSSFSLRGLVPSHDGTVWVLGHGTIVRVRCAHETAAGFVIVERLGGLHGLPSAAAEDLLELDDGSVWITTTVGLVQVPARARATQLQAPGVELVDVVVNGARVDNTSTVRLREDDMLELRFAALSFRDRSRLRHQYRLHPDARWTTSQGGPGVFQFPDLGPGAYRVEVRASLDGRAWSGTPAVLAFQILPPWYQRAWALALLATLLAGGGYVAFRLRLAFLLRLERQRTRIAMDLHDEIGAGLGSIHILAGLAAERTAADASHAGLVQTISDTAAELAASLGEIVWSLRARSASLETLASHLADRAAKLFPPGGAELTLAIPDSLPPLALSLPVRWNVSLIAIEALHNAARHASAESIVLGLEPHGSRWRLWIEDDGVGFGHGSNGGGGHGIEIMKRRAAEIGGELTIEIGASGGRIVTLVFDPLTEGTRA